MIKSNKRRTMAKGNGKVLLVDYANITRSLIDAFVESGVSREAALKMVAEAHRVGTLTEQEVDNEVKDAMKTHLMELKARLMEAANALGKDIEDGGEADE